MVSHLFRAPVVGSCLGDQPAVQPFSSQGRQPCSRGATGWWHAWRTWSKPDEDPHEPLRRILKTLAFYGGFWCFGQKKPPEKHRKLISFGDVWVHLYFCRSVFWGCFFFDPCGFHVVWCGVFVTQLVPCCRPVDCRLIFLFSMFFICGLRDWRWTSRCGVIHIEKVKAGTMDNSSEFEESSKGRRSSRWKSTNH